MPGPTPPGPFHPKDILYNFIDFDNTRTASGTASWAKATLTVTNYATLHLTSELSNPTPPPGMWHPAILKASPFPPIPVATVGVSRAFNANSGTSSSAKATIGVVKSCIAKVPTASSAKATSVSRVQQLLTKSATSDSSKASTVVRTRLLLVRLATTSGGKATTTTLQLHLITTVPTAASARATLAAPDHTIPIITTTPTVGGTNLGKRGPWYPDRTPEQVLMEDEELMVLL